MSGTRYVDFGAPISESGDRDEVIAIKLGGGIKNPTEMMFYAMKYNGYDKWSKKYPGIQTLDQFSKEERFIRCTYFTEENFLRAMRAPLDPLPQEEIKIDTGIVRGEYLDLKSCHITAMEVGLHNMLSHSLCKQLHIFDAEFTDSAKEYIYYEYQAYKNKISLVTGSLIEIVENLPNITTIIMDDIEEIVRMIEYEEVNHPELLKYKAFWIASNCSIDTTKSISKSNGKISHKYDDFMENAAKRDGFQVNWFNHSIVSFDHPGVVTTPDGMEISSGQNIINNF